MQKLHKIDKSSSRIAKIFKKIKVKTSKSEKDLIVKSLVKMRNKLIRENKSAEPVNELLIKLIENK